MIPQAFGLLDRLRSAEIASHQQYESLETFHLRWLGGDGLDYLTLDESLAGQHIEITEFTEAGQVPLIRIVNHSEHIVFLMAGEQLVGCKQNRVMNASIMVPAHSKMPLPVSCVERGRWGYSSPTFSSPHSSSHHRLRAKMVGQTTMGYRRSGAPTADQTAVWREVAEKLMAMGSSSSSDSLQDLFQDYTLAIEESLKNLPAPTDSNGAVFVIGGRIAGADFFDKGETLRKLWPKLIKSCTIDALELPKGTPASMPSEEVLKWLTSSASAALESFPSPGTGNDVRIEGQHILGAGLIVDDQPVHIELFPRTEPPLPSA